MPKQFDVEDAYTITPHLTNQFKWGYTRFYMPIFIAPIPPIVGSPSHTSAHLASPTCQVGRPLRTFRTSRLEHLSPRTTAPSQWGPNTNRHATQLTIPNNYALVDNVQWLKGKHVMTFGFTYMLEGLNNANPAT